MSQITRSRFGSGIRGKTTLPSHRRPHRAKGARTESALRDDGYSDYGTHNCGCTGPRAVNRKLRLTCGISDQIGPIAAVADSLMTPREVRVCFEVFMPVCLRLL